MQSVHGSTAIHQQTAQTLKIFKLGDELIYGLQGKFKIVAVETKSVAGQVQNYYRMEKVKLPFRRNEKKETSLWVPVQKARANGLRASADADLVQEGLRILGNKEIYFELHQDAKTLIPLLEQTCIQEGFFGLCKALSRAFALQKTFVIPPKEVALFYKTVEHAVLKEICAVTLETLPVAEARIRKLMSPKLESIS